MSELLERRYRTLLRMLPKNYRQARGEELLGTLMDGADERRRWPDVREALSVAVLSLRTRFTAGGARRSMRGLPRAGETARAVALLGAALLALAGLDNLNQVYAQLHTLFPPKTSTGHMLVRWTVQVELPALWLIVYLLLVLGRWVPARVLAVSLFLVTVPVTVGDVGAVIEHLLLVAVVTAATMVARGADARRVGGDRHRLAVGVTLAAVAAVAAGLVAAARHYPANYRWVWDSYRVLFLSPSTQRGTELSDALVITLLGVIAALAVRSPVWPLAATLAGAALLVPWAGLLARHGSVIGQGLHRMVAEEGLLVVVTALAVYKDRRAVRAAAPLPAD
jgi:hypothetical protein